MVYAVINRFAWFLDMLGNSTSQTCRTTYFRGQGQRITLQWPLQLYWSWSCKSWVMGVFWTGDSYSDNDFVVKVIHRVNIDLHMTFRLAIGLQVCSIGYWVFSTRQLVWLCFISFRCHLEGMYWPSYDLKTSNRYTGLNYRSWGFLDLAIDIVVMNFMSRWSGGHIITLILT